MNEAKKKLPIGSQKNDKPIEKKTFHILSLSINVPQLIPSLVLYRHVLSSFSAANTDKK
jgi:hypothetical protein